MDDRTPTHESASKPQILRESEFFGGCIRVKISVKNLSGLAFLDVALELENDENILHCDRCQPEYPEKKGKIILGNINPGTDRTIAFYLDPLICAKEGTDINCRIFYKDAYGRSEMVQMEPLKIKVICPIFRTEQEINIGRLKELIAELRFHDSKVYTFPKKVELQELLRSCRDVIQLHDVRHIKTFKTMDEKTYESWYYGKTKVTKKDLVIKCAIRKETESIEVMASGNDPGDITGLLAELGRNLTKEFETIGKVQPVFNITIKDSVIQRSNLLSYCDLDGSCGGNVVIEDSVVQRSDIGSGNEIQKKEEELEIEETVTPNQKECHVCENLITESNKSLVCMKCRSRFCLTCEGWFREERKRGEKPLCEKCFGEELGSEKQKPKQEKERNKSQELPKTYANSISMKFTLIPAGEFLMGSEEQDSEKPVHNVKISKPFYLGTYPVMQKEWKSIMGNNPSNFKGDNFPVESISWNDVQEFIKKLNKKEGFDKYRLPTEAEWEYAARADTKTRYSFGDEESKLGDYAWYTSNSGNKTHDVGQKKPNPWGLYDMHGNVWEWVQDNWHGDYNGAPTDGSSWESGSYRVVRGGGWDGYAGSCRSAFRGGYDPGGRYYHLGFRLLRIL